ncbi:MAG: DUF4292 domain-containing protein [Oceanihabitans sp.]
MQVPKIIYASLIIVFALVSCKSAKSVSSNNTNLNLTAKQLIKENTKVTPNFKTLAARIKLEIIEGEKSKSYAVSLRIKKNNTIWLSGGLGMVKARITPNSVSFYNKLDNTFFEGDYAYLSDVLGTQLDFNKVQNLLLGEALYSLNSNTYEAFTQDNQYVLKPKVQPEAFELFYILSAAHFKINSQQLAQEKEQRMLQIDYTNYQEIANQTFPKYIKINAIEGIKETKINVEFKSIALNEKLSFPFKIPSGYEKIVLK